MNDDNGPKTPRDLETLFAETTVQTLIGTVEKSRARGATVAPAVLMADHFGERFGEIALGSARRHASDLVRSLPSANMLGLPAELFKQVAVAAIETVFGYVMNDLVTAFKAERGADPRTLAAQLLEQITGMSPAEGQGLGGMVS